MNLSHSSNRRRMITGVSLIALSVPFLADIVAGSMTRPSSPSQTTIAIVGFVAVANAVLMTVAILGLSHLLRPLADGVGLVGAASTLVGWAASTRISVVIQLGALQHAGVEGVPANALESTFKSAPIVWTSVFPVGLFFPLGLITLGLALFWWRPVNWWLGLLLALGGVLFPVGRAVGIGSAIIACDILLGAAFAGIGWQVLTRRGVWEAASGRGETMNETLSRELRARA